METECRASLLAGAAAWRARHGPLACAVPFTDRVLAAHDNFTYGHIWSPIYSFLVRFVQKRLCSAYAIPAVEPTTGQLVYTELATLLSLERRPVVRVPWVPVCLERDDPCCAEAPAHGVISHAICGELAFTPERTLALRADATSALEPAGGLAPASVLFVSNRGASNGRRIEDEGALVEAISAAAQRIGLRFVVLDASANSYADELRLVQGARFLVSLFGSALHNCRFMRAGGTVVEIHGALGNDFRSSGYWNLCNCQIGLRYVGVRTELAVPRQINGSMVYGPDDPDPAPTPRNQRHFRRYQMHARVNASAVAHAIEAAARGEWAALTQEYAADLRIFDGKEANRACFLRMMMAAPCPTRLICGGGRDFQCPGRRVPVVAGKPNTMQRRLGYAVG